MNEELIIPSGSSGQTLIIGEFIGRHISSPTVIALIGDLGSGKTVFAKGLAAGLEVPETFYITSPTYTIMNEYPGRIPLYHMDLYRIESILELEEVGFDDIRGQECIIIVEWADRIAPQDMDADITVRIKISGDQSRLLHFSILGYRYLDLYQQIKNRFGEK